MAKTSVKVRLDADLKRQLDVIRHELSISLRRNVSFRALLDAIVEEFLRDNDYQRRVIERLRHE